MSKNITINTIRAIDATNANRNDAGSPKTIMLGGVERFVHSSQSMNRAMRRAMKEKQEGKYGGCRTKQLDMLMKDALVAEGCPTDKLDALSDEVCKTFIGGKKKEGKPSKKKVEEEDEGSEEESGTTIGYFAPSEVTAVAKALKGCNWDVKTAADKKALTKAMASIPAISKHMDAVDIALFGRMFASAPELNVDAALLRAFSVSTHEATPEVDFFTAVDDLERGQGSAHMGTKEMGSAVMAGTYILNLDQLRTNLLGASEEDIKGIAKDVIEGVLMYATPLGNRTTMLSNTLPQYAVVTFSEGVPCAASFETPVNAGVSGGYVDGSIEALKAEVLRINSFQKVTACEEVVTKMGLNQASINKVVANV